MATIRKRNTKYQVQIRRIGQRSASRTFLSRKTAEEWARQMELRADRRDLPPDPKILESTILSQLVEQYRDKISPRKKTSENEQIVLNAFLRHPICRKSLSELGASDFAQYRDDRLNRVKASTLKRELVPIKHMFEVAREEWGYPLKTNPLSSIRLVAPDVGRVRRLAPEELEKLWAAAKLCRASYMPPLIALAVATAMRRGEMLRLQRADIDYFHRTIFVAESKNGSSRTIPLTKEAEAAFSLVKHGRDHLFPMSPNAVRLSWEHLRDRAGLSDLHFHDLRHEAISRLFEKGLTIPEVALISGHKDYRMLFRYAHAVRSTILEKLDGSYADGQPTLIR